MSVGHTTYSVLKECGVPDAREITVVEQKKTSRKKTRQTRTVMVYPGKKYDGPSSGHEMWYYDCGPDQFITVLTFRDSRLISIKSGGRGTRKGLPCPMSTEWTKRKELDQ
ncbi:MAG: DUF2845 domain-containing protein [Deltaproteobacteria bacterium]|nr:DUF2845 domain-containing protein [Deltaproteobacteria bacterium]